MSIKHYIKENEISLKNRSDIFTMLKFMKPFEIIHELTQINQELKKSPDMEIIKNIQVINDILLLELSSRQFK